MGVQAYGLRPGTLFVLPVYGLDWIFRDAISTPVEAAVAYVFLSSYVGRTR